jgi:hypothetical protein
MTDHMDLEIKFEYINGYLKKKCDMFIINPYPANADNMASSYQC